MALGNYIALMRLEKPIGIWLLFFPAAWGLLMAPHPVFQALPLLLFGAVVTRSAGCVINDIIDRRLDARVARTRTRPLASGAIPLHHASILLAFLLSLALLTALQFSRAVLVWSLAALPLIAAYPWMKRITWWPQLFLGITFNLGAIIGWVATGAPITLPALLLYAACICWTLGYDTIYALQDRDDDALIGVKSSARALGENLPRFIDATYSLMVLLLIGAGYVAGLDWPYYAGVGLVGLHTRWQYRQLKNPGTDAGSIFRSNQWLGFGMLLCLVLARVHPSFMLAL